MALQYGGAQATITTGILHDGYQYTGSNADLLALTAADIDDLLANFPHQADLTADQYDTWLKSAYVQRHLFDDINATPGMP